VKHYSPIGPSKRTRLFSLSPSPILPGGPDNKDHPTSSSSAKFTADDSSMKVLFLPVGAHRNAILFPRSFLFFPGCLLSFGGTWRVRARSCCGYSRACLTSSFVPPLFATLRRPRFRPKYLSRLSSVVPIVPRIYRSSQIPRLT